MGCRSSTQEICSTIQNKMPDAKYNISDHENFHIVQLFTGCLAEMAYYIESNKEAVVIDPLREVEPYLEIAHQRGAQIKYIFLTHFHADFVSGHYDLAKKTGATIVFGPNAVASFAFHLGKDQEKFNIGKIIIQLIHTPGHTLESSSFLLLEGETQHAIFTGDTLFLGEVGRPDLAVKSGEITKEDLASHLYDSLRNKIMKLDPKITVYPGHGAGSPCGKKIADGTVDTLENQLKTNYALQQMERKQFIDILTADLPVPPQYFFHDVAMNKSSPVSVDQVVIKNLVFIKPESFLSEVANTAGAVILDSRPPKIFEKGFVANSINVSLSVTFAIWVGTLFKADTPFFIVTESGKERETIIRLARIGYDHVVGCLKGGFEAYQELHLPSNTIKSITSAELKDEFHIVDVRNAPELSHGHLKTSINIPLGELEAKIQAHDINLPKDKPIYMHCKSGGRSMIACSILAKNGYSNQINVDGGFEVIKTSTTLQFNNLGM